MGRLAVVVAVVIGGVAVAGRANAQDWKQWVPKLPSSPRSEQKESARHLMPVSMKLHGSGAAPREPRVIRVRVWAAADFRRQTREWSSRFRRLVERVNGAARDWRFEVVEQKSWPRESSEGALDSLVDELAKMDAGDDVDLVVGLVAALPVFPGSVDNIGMGKLFSKHMVMRSLHDLAEYDVVRSWFDTFTESEKEAILAARKLHKEQVIFLHEWAHTLGLIHVKREAGIMNPAYDASMSGFDETELRYIDAALGRRSDELRAIVESSPDGDWDPRDRRQLLGWLQQLTAPRTASTQPMAPPPPMPTTTQPPQGESKGRARARAGEAARAEIAANEGKPLADADRAALAEALALGRAGKHDDAWQRLAAIEGKHPRNAEVKLAACELTARHPSGAARATLTEVACHAAAELAPSDPRPYLWLADLYLGAGDTARAQPSLARAAELLGNAVATAAVARRAKALRLHPVELERCEEALHGDAVEPARSACHIVLAGGSAHATLPELRAAWNDAFGGPRL